jgi:hypothetical protein
VAPLHRAVALPQEDGVLVLVASTWISMWRGLLRNAPCRPSGWRTRTAPRHASAPPPAAARPRCGRRACHARRPRPTP